MPKQICIFLLSTSLHVQQEDEEEEVEQQEEEDLDDAEAAANARMDATEAMEEDEDPGTQVGSRRLARL